MPSEIRPFREIGLIGSGNQNSLSFNHFFHSTGKCKTCWGTSHWGCSLPFFMHLAVAQFNLHNKTT